MRSRNSEQRRCQALSPKASRSLYPRIEDIPPRDFLRLVGNGLFEAWPSNLSLIPPFSPEKLIGSISANEAFGTQKPFLNSGF